MAANQNERLKIVIIGAGPAGLTAGLEAINLGHDVVVAEQDPEYVGGISRTVKKEGYRFDIGGHRFFSKNTEIQKWWKARLSEDFLKVDRQSRIYFENKFFDYPLDLKNVLANLGLWQCAMCFLSYLKSRIFPIKNVKSFEDWVINQFGNKLYQTFFKSYTEKVWGISCSKISKDWAAQRIKGLSMSQAILHAIRPQKKGPAKIKTLINKFNYPRFGPGQLWEETADTIVQKGGTILMGQKAIEFQKDGNKIRSATFSDKDGNTTTIEGDHFLVSMPLSKTISGLSGNVPDKVKAAASHLTYRDFLTVALVLKDKDLFTDQWIYIHDPNVRVGRIQNYKNWSKWMIPEEGYSCLGLEYFCNTTDDFWNWKDEELIQLAKQECSQLGFTSDNAIEKGFVVRAPKAYPVYTEDYSSKIIEIKKYLDTIDNLQVIGRNGMHKYNNQDHSMMTAILAVKNLGARTSADRPYDLWKVNSDAAYHEETKVEFNAGRATPEPIKPNS
ncbi:NAD(P)/FAD-dependent oxidoreductase [Puniceicoccaceae bacterium K14]|nr:NAD(P)/FAD-dependent oxidoreductase [Puniceicoccaceae bacterium K14]